MLRQRLRSALSALTGTLVAGALVALTPHVAQADEPPLPLPSPSSCNPGPWNLTQHYEEFAPADGPWRVAPGDNLEVTVTKSRTIEVGAQLTVGVSAEWAVAKVNAELGISTKVSWTSSVGLKTNTNSPAHELTHVYYGVFTERVLMERTWSPAGCNKGWPYTLQNFQSAMWLQLPKSEGFKKVSMPLGRGGVGTPGTTNPPAPPQPQPVTSVHGLADGTLLHTTDTRRIYKMVGGAPVWQATCDSGICDSPPRPTTQSVIDAGPKTPRNGSSAIDQRGRIYIYVGGAPLHQSHCNSPVNCGRPPKISDWSIDARDHMNQVPADGNLLQGWNGGNGTPVAQTVGGARLNFGSPQEVIDTGFGTDWASKVVIVSDYSFNNLGTIPADGTLVQGTGGGASTPVAMFVAGSRINFASPEEVVETGYGTNWRQKVRAIPSRAFNEFHADIPPDGSLVQGIANGVPTPVAIMLGGARINFGSPQEVIDSGFGTDWASKVRTVPTRAFNMIRADVPDDGTLVQGTGGNSPVAAIIGGARVNFASPQEVIDSGFGTDWASKVRALPARAFSLIPDRIGDGTRVKKAGATSQAGIVGGAKVPFASMDELIACGFGDKRMWTIPDRVWDALTTEIADGTRLKKAGWSSEAAVVGGARVDFWTEAERNDAGYGGVMLQYIPARVWDAMTTRIADGTRIAKSGWSSEAAVVGGARVDFWTEAERNDAGYGGKPRQVVPIRVWDALPQRIADGTRVKKASTTSQAGIIGGAKVPFASMDELIASGFGNKPMWTVPDRVWNALPTRFADNTLLKSPESATVWRVVDGRKAQITDPAATVWVVPQRILDAIPEG